MKKILGIMVIVLLTGYATGCSKKKNENRSKPPAPSKNTSPLPPEIINSVNRAGKTTGKGSGSGSNSILNLKLSSQVHAKLKPERPTTNTDITVVLPEDFTGEIQWYVNGERIIGEMGRTLSSRYFKRGDTVKVVAISSEGKKYVAETKVVNANPQISSTDDDFELDDQLIYHIKTYDPDGDTVKVEVMEAPEGYKYDPQTRTLIIPFEDLPGEQLITFVIKAEDPYGGYIQKKIAYRLNIDIEKFK